jgi:hypothetical protein
VIAELREELAGLIRTGVPALVVHQWFPEDVPELPCAVVGRPTLLPDPDAATAILATTVITVVGRRYTADEAQDELDRMTWSVLGSLNWLRGTRTADVQRLIVSSVEPDLVSIAGDEYPCYRIAADAHLIAC